MCALRAEAAGPDRVCEHDAGIAQHARIFPRPLHAARRPAAGREQLVARRILLRRTLGGRRGRLRHRAPPADGGAVAGNGHGDGGHRVDRRPPPLLPDADLGRHSLRNEPHGALRRLPLHLPAPERGAARALGRGDGRRGGRCRGTVHHGLCHPPLERQSGGRQDVVPAPLRPRLHRGRGPEGRDAAAPLRFCYWTDEAMAGWHLRWHRTIQKLV